MHQRRILFPQFPRMIAMPYPLYSPDSRIWNKTIGSNFKPDPVTLLGYNCAR